MIHLFSSGEVMYDKNQKILPEGTLIGSNLEYDAVELKTEYKCFGTLNNKGVVVSFFLSPDDFEQVNNRYRFGILMQSDILQAEWDSYEIKYID